MTIPSLLTRTKAPDAPAHFTLTGIAAPPFAGRVFGVNADVCQNPLCHCKELYLYFFLDSKMEPEHFAFVVRADSLAQTIHHSREQGYSLAAAQLLEQHFSPDDWAALKQIWWGIKVALIEHLTLEQAAELAYPFPDDSSLIPYQQVFPGCLWLAVQHGGQHLIGIDLYCTNPGCACTDMILEFFPDGQSAMTFAIEYNYQTGRVGRERTRGIALPAAAALIETISSATPDLDSMLARRNQILRVMHQKQLEKQALLRLPGRDKVRLTMVGRNTPCPCGSGKKYKHCCGK